MENKKRTRLTYKRNNGSGGGGSVHDTEIDEEYLIQKITEKLVPKKKKKLNFDSEEEEQTIFLRDNHLYYSDHVMLCNVDKVKQLMRDYLNQVEELQSIKFARNFTPKPLYLHINSSGGDLLAGLTLYDFIVEYSTHIPVHTIIEGLAASAATIISVAGVKRYITPSSYLLIHQLSTVFGGTYSNIKDEKENCDKLMQKITEIYLGKSKLTKKKLEELLARDIYLSASESKKYGLVDEIKSVDIFND
jgi:ATP-dependent Clp endopeptidase proteolytic subunit ClpP